MRHGGTHTMGPREGREMVRGAADSGSFLIDAKGTIVGFDGDMERLTGWTAADVVGRLAEARLMVEGGFEPARARDTAEMSLFCRDGHVLDVEVAVAQGEGAVNRFTVSVLRVISRVEAGRSLPCAGRDPLTGLATREAFVERLAFEMQAASATGKPLAILIADVDHLRKVVDTHGREAAAGVLRKLAGVLRAIVRDDDLVARLEDDDFAVVLAGLGRGSARQIAARLRSNVERTRFTAVWDMDVTFGVTLSIGAASYPTDADNETDLLTRAQEALEEARALGRNRVWCYTRRPRVPLRTPVYLDGSSPLLLGYSQDLSPSGLFVSTPAPIDVGMRCALSFPLPTLRGNVHVIGRVVRTVPRDGRSPGMGVEFERFGPQDRHAIEAYLYENQAR